LALQFSSFKICGANARCIAALTAFKTVKPFSNDRMSGSCNVLRAGYTRLQDSAK
jgi:hypothetical protein